MVDTKSLDIIRVNLSPYHILNGAPIPHFSFKSKIGTEQMWDRKDTDEKKNGQLYY